MSGRIGRMRPPVSRQLTLTVPIAAAFVALPAIVFYWILFRTAIDIPFQDDYEALLDFLNQIAELKSTSAKISYLAAAQFNEYKLFFGHGLAWLQFALFGKSDVRVLCALGNGFVLLLAILLWTMFLPNHKNLAHRFALFIPASWLLFQLQYVETLNWAMPALATLPVLVFSLGSFYLLMRSSRMSFCGALVCLVLAVASFGNGFLMVPVGTLILAVDRHYARILGWLAISAACVAMYAYRYVMPPSHARIYHSLFSTLISSRPLYVIAFMGSTAAVPFGGLNHRFVVLSSIVLGLLICTFFIAIARRGYIRRNPLISYCVLFIVLTAIGVAGLRSDLGIAHSLDSRYKIYSALLLVFVWFAIAEEFLQDDRLPIRRNLILLVAIIATALFSLSMDIWGVAYLLDRNRRVVTGMTAFEHPVSSEELVGPILPYPNQDPRLDELDRRAPLILRQSMNLGVYRPPAY